MWGRRGQKCGQKCAKEIAGDWSSIVSKMYFLFPVITSCFLFCHFSGGTS